MGQSGPGSPAGGLVFEGVTLASAVGAGPPVPGLSLAVERTGITITDAAGEWRSLPWARLDDPIVVESQRLLTAPVAPGTEDAVVLAASVGGRPVRWLIPPGQVTSERFAGLRTLVPQVAAPLPPPPADVPAPPAPPAPFGGPSFVPPSPAARAAQPWPGGGWTAPPPPAGSWAPPPGAAEAVPSGARPSRTRRRGLAIAGVTLIAAAVVLAVVAAAAGGPGSAPRSGTSAGASARADRQVAEQINLSAADLPPDWTIDSSGQSPIQGFLGGGGGGSPSVTPTEHQQAEQIAQHFEQCMGLPSGSDRIFGAASVSPVAGAASPVFKAAGAASLVEAGSSVSIFRSASSVTADLTQISNPKFPGCFGTALGAYLVIGASAAASATVGAPQVAPMSLTASPGARVAGVTVDVPLTNGSVTASLQIGVVLVGGGRAEATLVTFATPGAFSVPLTSDLAADLERNVATDGSGTGA
ncbi:MAG TPA: hypothetical protein VKG43_05315 [Acidimicrobiales bacterium]|nr:hypothetical protein [Acidimicrobiales bacterium]